MAWSRDFEKINKPSRHRFQNPCAEIPLLEDRWVVQMQGRWVSFETYGLMARWFRNNYGISLEYPPAEEIPGVGRIVRRH